MDTQQTVQVFLFHWCLKDSPESSVVLPVDLQRKVKKRRARVQNHRNEEKEKPRKRHGNTVQRTTTLRHEWRKSRRFLWGAGSRERHTEASRGAPCWRGSSTERSLRDASFRFVVEKSVCKKKKGGENRTSIGLIKYLRMFFSRQKMGSRGRRLKGRPTEATSDGFRRKSVEENQRRLLRDLNL